LSVEYLHRCVVKLHSSQVRIARHINVKKERNKQEREINRSKEIEKAEK
jgi:hypothetical protein